MPLFQISSSQFAVSQSMNSMTLWFEMDTRLTMEYLCIKGKRNILWWQYPLIKNVMFITIQKTWLKVWNFWSRHLTHAPFFNMPMSEDLGVMHKTKVIWKQSLYLWLSYWLRSTTLKTFKWYDVVSEAKIIIVLRLKWLKVRQNL